MYSPDVVKTARRFLNGEIAPMERLPSLMKLVPAHDPHTGLLQLPHMLISGRGAKLRPEALIYWFGQAVRGWTVMDRLGEIRGPALVLAGRDGFQFPPEHQVELAAGNPNSRLVNIERAGHNAHLERSAEVIRAIRDFMADGSPSRT